MKSGGLKMFLFGNGLAIVFVTLIARYYPSALSAVAFKYLVGVLVVALAWRLFGRKPKPGSKLDPNTRAYARAMFHNGLISMAELNHFYETHPEAENGKPSTSS